MPKILQDRDAVICETQKEFNAVVDEAYKQGLKWSARTQIESYKYFNEYIGIAIAFDFGSLGYSEVEWYQKNRYNVMSFAKFMQEEKTIHLTEKELADLLPDERRKTIDEIIGKIKVNPIFIASNRCIRCGQFTNKHGVCKKCSS